ncbi:class I SAM-dependent methyltransferase [Allokutzneria sp. NRRL B-24872]|uniref:class I SAM-dependent DNA methyltransferase n=1 Tax=Allokutzneria sp. NRRL B-24872 TaxID=1137961 RepID=UPI001FF01894|nr:class I SAM-dependent methyltransferase [Allokutzneria sp. NRRL B-24872]
MTEPDFLRDTRSSYNTMAASYTETFKSGIDNLPVDRAVLAVFAELVRDTGNVDAVDVGSGPGHVTEYLKSLGLNIFGIDLSSEMVALARGMRPGVRFEEGSMTALELPEGSLGGVCAWYSTIHIPSAQLPEVLSGFRRVLAPGGWLTLAFQSGDHVQHYDEGFGHKLSLDFYRREAAHVAELLGAAGFEVYTRTERGPNPDERTSQAYLTARAV